MDAPARVTTGIAVAASLVLQACSMLPQDMAVDTSSSASPAQAIFTQDDPSDGSVDQAIARLRNDLLKVERLEADAARLYAEAEKMRVKRECTLEEYADFECGISPEAGEKMHQAGKLAAEAAWLRRSAW